MKEQFRDAISAELRKVSSYTYLETALEAAKSVENHFYLDDYLASAQLSLKQTRRLKTLHQYTVTDRLLLKDIWCLSGQQWDNDLSDDVSKKFLEWAKELPNLSERTIPRCYFRGMTESIELHVFGDSSQGVFSAVAFLRARVGLNERTETQVALVFGKVCVAPMKTLTIPKLELRAALLAAQLTCEIQQALTEKRGVSLHMSYNARCPFRSCAINGHQQLRHGN